MLKSRLSIGIRNLRVTTLIGVYAQERLKTQEIILNLELEIDERGISISDQLCDTVDYAMVAGQLSNWMKTQNSHLIEHLAHLAILKVFELDPRIAAISLEILKPGCIPNADGAVVKLSCSRDELLKHEYFRNDRRTSPPITQRDG